MGIFGWLLKNGPGSPGSTSKVFVREYLKHNSLDHNEYWQVIFSSLFRQRVIAFNQIGLAEKQCYFKDVDMNEIVEFSDGDLALFVFEMMFLETSNFRKNISNTFNEVTKIIYETILNDAPNTLKYNLNDFRLNAKSFMTNF